MTRGTMTWKKILGNFMVNVTQLRINRKQSVRGWIKLDLDGIHCTRLRMPRNKGNVEQGHGWFGCKLFFCTTYLKHSTF